jgi:hypothetical protein
MVHLTKYSLVGRLRGILDLAFWAGLVFSCVLAGIFLFAGIYYHSIPHLYEPQLTLSFKDPPLAVTGIHTSTEYVALGRWKTTLFAVEHSSIGFLALQLAWIVVQPGVTLGILWHLKNIARSVEAGEPFSERAAGRLKSIGLLIIAGAVGRSAEDLLAGAYARNHYLLSRGSIELSFDYEALLWGVAVGLMILVLAEVFLYGHAMRQEQELTV